MKSLLVAALALCLPLAADGAARARPSGPPAPAPPATPALSRTPPHAGSAFTGATLVFQRSTAINFLSCHARLGRQPIPSSIEKQYDSVAHRVVTATCSVYLPRGAAGQRLHGLIFALTYSPGGGRSAQTIHTHPGAWIVRPTLR